MLNDRVDFELKNNGRVLVLKDIFIDPVTGRYQDITLKNSGWTLFGFDLGGGETFHGITQDVVEEIQRTYGIVLKTLQSSNAEFTGNEKSTTFTMDDGSWFGRSITSYPFGEKQDDVTISQEDAAHYGFSQMTIHDAVNAGIYHAYKRCQSESVERKPESENAPVQTVDPIETKNAVTEEKKGIEAQQVGSQGDEVEKPVETSLTARPYDLAPFHERRRRLIEHLEKKSSVPFSAFVNQNREKKIGFEEFQRMLSGMRKLAKNPESGDKDAREMRQVFKDWFKAAYQYLQENSTPGDGYSQIAREVGEKIKDARQAEEKAKELYWRRHATLSWMTLIDLFATEKIGIDSLLDSISKTSFGFWF